MQLNPWQICFASTFAMLMLSSLIAAEGPTSRPATTRAARPKPGEILKLEKDSITAMPNRRPMQGEKLEPLVFSLDDQTQVYVGQITSERTNEAGRVVRSFDMVPGTREDLKVGRRVMIRPDGGRAARIDLMPEDPPTTRKSE
jgi:hypothetical protein